MKIVIDMYDLGFKMHDLTEDQILMAVGRQPQYRERIYKWDTSSGCRNCAVLNQCYCLKDEDDLCSEIRQSLPADKYTGFLQPYFKKEVI